MATNIPFYFGDSGYSRADIISIFAEALIWGWHLIGGGAFMSKYVIFNKQDVPSSLYVSIKLSLLEIILLSFHCRVI